MKFLYDKIYVYNLFNERCNLRRSSDIVDESLITVPLFLIYCITSSVKTMTKIQRLFSWNLLFIYSNFLTTIQFKNLISS